MIRKSIVATIVISVVLAGFIAAAQAFHEGPHRRERLTMTPFEAVLSPQQKQALLSMVKADRSKLEALHQRLHQAREALIQKLLSPDAAIDISQETAELKAAQAAMIDERLSIALAARKLLSPKQLKDAAAFHARLEDLHRQEATLLQQMEGGKQEPQETGADE